MADNARDGLQVTLAAWGQQLGELLGVTRGIQRELAINTEDTRKNRHEIALVGQHVAGLSERVTKMESRLLDEVKANDKRMADYDVRLDDMEKPVEQFKSFRAHVMGGIMALTPIGAILTFFFPTIQAWFAKHVNLDWKF